MGKIILIYDCFCINQVLTCIQLYYIIYIYIMLKYFLQFFYVCIFFYFKGVTWSILKHFIIYTFFLSFFFLIKLRNIPKITCKSIFFKGKKVCTVGGFAPHTPRPKTALHNFSITAFCPAWNIATHWTYVHKYIL